MSITINGKVLCRRDTTANWEYVNPVLANGEVGYDTTIRNFKVGDGVTVWSGLPYWSIAVHIPIVYTITAGDTQPRVIAHPFFTWPTVLFKTPSGDVYGGATYNDDGTNITVTGDADGSGGFADTFKVIVKA